MKLLVIGHARHGKDTVCEFLREDFGLRFMSSSLFVARQAVGPALRKRGIVYESFEAMYEDRVNRRAEWHEAIAAYNAQDPARLARELLLEHDIYCGLRSLREFAAASEEGLFDAVFWVERRDWQGESFAPEARLSNKLSAEFADFVIPNYGTLEELRLATGWAMRAALKKRMVEVAAFGRDRCSV